MDVLYNTINVRDLLSSSDSPNSPILAPDLRLLISRLDVHSLRIKSIVQSYLLSHQADFASLFSQCSDVVSKSENLSSQVIALLNLISDQPIESDVGKIIGERVEKRRELVEKREILDLVGVVLELDRKFDVVSFQAIIGFSIFDPASVPCLCACVNIFVDKPSIMWSNCFRRE